MLVLRLRGHIVQGFIVQPERLMSFHGVHFSLSPYLVDLVLQPDELPPVYAAHGNRPESPVAGAVTQELYLVCGAEEYALPRARYDVAAIGGTEHILLFGDEVLDGLDLRAFCRGQLGQLDDPRTGDALVCLLAAESCNAVREPPTRERERQARFADTLLSDEHDHVVEFASGLVYTRDRCT